MSAENGYTAVELVKAGLRNAAQHPDIENIEQAVFDALEGAPNDVCVSVMIDGLAQLGLSLPLGCDVEFAEEMVDAWAVAIKAIVRNQWRRSRRAKVAN